MAAPGLPSAEIPRGAVVFVVNPRARHALPAAALVDIFTEACHPFGLRAHVVETHSYEQARWLAAEAHRAEAIAIFAYGGDGALHTTMQGIPPGSPLPLGCIPAGTANVWAAEAGIPPTPLAAVRAQLDALFQPPTWIDAGLARSPDAERRFLLMAGYGLDALAVRRVASRSKRLLGKAAYGLAGTQVALTHGPLRLRIQFDDDAPFSADVGLLTIGNTRMYGSLVEFTYRASAVDGQLDAVLFRGSPFRVLASAPLAFRRLHQHAPGVSYHRFRRLRVWQEEPDAPPLETQMDGEVGLPNATEIQVQPAALRVLAPNPRSALFQPPQPVD